MEIKRFDNFIKLEEERTTPKCKIESFAPLRESREYKDLLSMGFNEVETPRTRGTQPKIGQEQYKKDTDGNISFHHPSLRKITSVQQPTSPGSTTGIKNVYQAMPQGKENMPYVNIKRDGGVKINIDFNKSFWLANMTRIDSECKSIGDYYKKMGNVIKYVCSLDKFPLTDDEIYSAEDYAQVIGKKIEESPLLIQDIQIPESLREMNDIVAGAEMLKHLGAFKDMKI